MIMLASLSIDTVLAWSLAALLTPQVALTLWFV